MTNDSGNQNSNLIRLMNIDIESGISPRPEDLSLIFEDLMIGRTVQPDFLKKYLYATEPSLKDISEALQIVAENQEDHISPQALSQIKTGLAVLNPGLEQSLPEDELHEIYNKLVKFLEESAELDGKNVEKLIINLIFVVITGSLATLTLPHLIKRRKEFADKADKAISWMKELFEKEK